MYSTYQSIDSSLKTPIQATTTKLNMADGSPMMAFGMTALHLRIADFKFTYTFIICNRLLGTEILFGIDIQKNFLCHMPRIKRKTATYKMMVDFSLTPETVNRRQQ